MSSMISYSIALSYLKRGWSVIPVNLVLDNSGKVQKKPMIAWREYQERLPTDEELHQWFDDGRVNAIGVVTGKISHIVVVDIDQSEILFTSPLMSKTISGGTHAFFRWTEELRNDAGIADKPVDFRGDGGFAVLPPSSLGSQGYSWIKEVDNMFLEPIPQELKQQLKIRKGIIKKQEQAVQDGLPIANEGNRNQTAARVAGILCQGISQKLLPLIGFKTLQEWNQTHCNPPLFEAELQRTWNSIYRAELRNHPANEDNFIQILSGDEVFSEYDKLQKLYGEGVSTGFNVLDEYFTFLPEQLYLFSAPTHQGKTTLALNIAGRVATFGENVLFCSLEQGVFIEPRVESILSGPFPSSLSLLVTSKMLMIDDLTLAISRLKSLPRLVVVDHIHFLKKKGKGATEDIDEIITNLQNMAKQLRVPVVIIAHTRKLNADRSPTLDDLRDSSSLSQVPSVVVLLHRSKNTDDQVVREKSYLSSYGSLIVAKNRIQGKTGMLPFLLKKSGEFSFS